MQLVNVHVAGVKLPSGTGGNNHILVVEPRSCEL